MVITATRMRNLEEDNLPEIWRLVFIFIIILDVRFFNDWKMYWLLFCGGHVTAQWDRDWSCISHSYSPNYNTFHIVWNLYPEIHTVCYILGFSECLLLKFKVKLITLVRLSKLSKLFSDLCYALSVHLKITAMKQFQFPFFNSSYLAVKDDIVLLKTDSILKFEWICHYIMF